MHCGRPSDEPVQRLGIPDGAKFEVVDATRARARLLGRGDEPEAGVFRGVHRQQLFRTECASAEVHAKQLRLLR